MKHAVLTFAALRCLSVWPVVSRFTVSGAFISVNSDSRFVRYSSSNVLFEQFRFLIIHKIMYECRADSVSFDSFHLQLIRVIYPELTLQLIIKRLSEALTNVSLKLHCCEINTCFISFQPFFPETEIVRLSRFEEENETPLLCAVKSNTTVMSQ